MDTEMSEFTVNPLSDSFYKVYSLSLENGYTIEPKQARHRQKTVENNNVNGVVLYDDAPDVIYDDPGVKYPDAGVLGEWPASKWKLSHIVSAVFVRVLLVGHNCLTVWRVTEDFDDGIFWFLITLNFLLIAEGLIVISRRGGVEYSWWCPCFLVYLATTIPSVWLLQLNQYNALVSEDERVIVSSTATNATTMAPSTPFLLTSQGQVTTDLPITTDSPITQKLVTMMFSNTLWGFQNFSTTTLETNTTFDANTTMSLAPSSPAAIENITTQSNNLLGQKLSISSETWLIIVQEALVYLLVFSRWLLPRGEVSREFLADLLLEFLAIASDIMELLAVFDEDVVRSNLTVTLWIMAVWSASFIQFIPILMHKRRLRSFRESPDIPCITKTCGDKFVEIVVTMMSIFLQDGPFLVLRMYIIIELRIVTYSLVFFILKNIVTLLLLVYRLSVMCYRLQRCRKNKDDV